MIKCGTASNLLSEPEADCRRWISCLSHEIRNPLTLISSSLQILEKEYPCVNDSPLWGQTKDDIQYLIRLLQDSSAAVREYQPEFTVFPVQELFRELSVSTRSLLEKHHIRLDISPADDSFANDAFADNESSKGNVPDTDNVPDKDNTFYSTPVIRADRTRLREALTNLLINAADALSSMPDPHNRRILLTANSFSDPSKDRAHAERNGDVICIHVRDNGPGIPDEYLETLFDPFVTHKSNGTGLGLSIVRNIAGLHGGTVSVETCTDAGASFTDFCLCIPLVSMAEP
ncbi:MAG: HAMP domain-containing histidine kinase [Lachnospiraceae bacterium]|nr:HAMP domain-containing histidine kinase [Lachnospiraceae bacterium]